MLALVVPCCYRRFSEKKAGPREGPSILNVNLVVVTAAVVRSRWPRSGADPFHKMGPFWPLRCHLEPDFLDWCVGLFKVFETCGLDAQLPYRIHYQATQKYGQCPIQVAPG